MKPTAANLTRWAGFSAIAAGIIFTVMGLIHPPAVLLSVATPGWALVHLLAIVMSCLGLFGMMGLYARQAEESGWLGLAGFLLFSLWLVIVTGFTFVEVYVLPLLISAAPLFVEGFLGMFTGYASALDMGALPTLWMVTGLLYMVGALLFGIGTFRAGILSRWAAGLFGLGAIVSPLFALLPHELEPLAAVPVGVGLAWLGYSLVMEGRAQAAQPLARQSAPQLTQRTAK